MIPVGGLDFNYNPDDSVGVWTVITSDGDFDAHGATPLEAVTRLAILLRGEIL